MLVANKDSVLALEAAGWADVAGRKPMSTNSVFCRFAVKTDHEPRR